ncbi:MULTISPECIES: alpha/beta fold hydrolase [unclassified Pseudomonas]|uniref:alpha/beta fold hydrolase n=1 Tax=unclassified Pseudomonas TaxID=196821 RepID=UPI000C868F23|nr:MULTISPECIES: alpha/beta fold hydrolase [unclassified Pseudomonas]PMV97151.1 alpha/beta hydrolase [Pseudomonas sp. GW460-C8]PMW17185.1 alpha/beta hydrolase [Pseudomonas sp. GW456-11-11-14-TSB2]PMW21094.1 alpha/beta hydrolase [Pseudomonas sp. GW456-E6]PMW33595.1 alpha/beta hydrolase [Pseudomonas sp. FW305-3-2-15-A-R2A1]PMW36578.1 alpha/beta hydrolase [Pseudomonas sp. GW460-7]
MKPETAIVEIFNKYKVYTERYLNNAADKTIILVNGSLATTASFAQTVRYLQPRFNVVLYDQPYAGQSRPHNRYGPPICKEDEAEILLELVEHFRADHVLSFSWGGAATLLALAQRPRRIEKAVISSFAARINKPMRDYLESGLSLLQACDRFNVGRLVNNTIGKHLPSLFKRFNYRHISSLAEHEYRQMHFHINEVLTQDTQCYVDCADAIEVPLLFVNGEWDEYTSAQDARLFAGHVRQCQFSTIKNTGHFLDMEHKAAWHDTQHALLGFLLPASSLVMPKSTPPLGSRHRYAASDRIFSHRAAHSHLPR